MQLHNGIWAWFLSLSKYFQEVVRICKEYISKHLNKGYKLLERTENILESGCCPELNVSLLLGPKEASYYHSLIGVMRWNIEIGWIDINTEVSLLSLHSAIPRQGHLGAALHIMGYLKLRHNTRLAFDPSYPVIGECNFWECDWTDFFEVAAEAIPPMHHHWEEKRWIFQSWWEQTD